MIDVNINRLMLLVKQYWNIEITSYLVLRNSNKLICEIQGSNNQQYILKGESSTTSRVERICHFANELHTILPTTHYLKTVNDCYTISAFNLIFTLELKLFGEEVDVLTDAHFIEIATSLGKLHNYSLKHKILLQEATSWSMFGGNATDAIGDYDENELSFRDFEHVFNNEPCFNDIKLMYEHARTRLKQVWSHLPTAATQGDFCPYNMCFEQHQLIGIFDFNLAGDEVLLNECVAVAIFFSWHLKYEGQLSPEDRFYLFIQHYQLERPFTQLEIDVFPLLYSIIRAFRFDRIAKGIADKEQKQHFLYETLHILEQPIVYKDIESSN